MNWLRKAILAMVHAAGYEMSRRRPRLESPAFRDFEDDFVELCRRVGPYTMTSPAKLYALYGAVRHLVGQRTPGAFVECGVWRGGSSMLMALVLRAMGETTRDLYLYDTFAGMAQPAGVDVDVEGVPARAEWDRQRKSTHNQWCYASREDVVANMRTTQYPDERIHCVQGKVEETLAQRVPDAVALLRLDTDFYASTAAELRHLYPRLVSGGILIIDDYGFWRGQRKAVDEFFANADSAPFLVRVDDSCRVAVKP